MHTLFALRGWERAVDEVTCPAPMETTTSKPNKLTYL